MIGPLVWESSRIPHQYPWTANRLECRLLALRVDLTGPVLRRLTKDKRTASGIGTTDVIDPNVWTGCVSQEGVCRVSEVADMYPACLIGTRAVALMGIRTRHWSH